MFPILFFLFTILALTTVSADASNANSHVVVLGPDNFDTIVGGDTAVFVEFYAPWCGHCKSLAPEYERVAAAFKDTFNVIIANLDADAHRAIGQEHGVTGFPTLQYFEAGSKKGEVYSGGRTAADITKYLNEKLGSNVRLPVPTTAVTVLDPSNFDKIVMDPTKDVLVEFYAPWCGHCKSLAPIYEQVAASFAGDDNVIVANVDADAHRDLGQRFGVTGYPTIKFFPKNNKEGEAYNGARNPNVFITFLNERSGSGRTLGGGYHESAGRVAELDSIVQRWLAAASDEKATIMEEAKAAAAKAGDYAKYYVHGMEKGVEWAKKETERLTRMLGGASVKPNHRASFAKRINIFKLFSSSSDDAAAASEKSDL
jgi:protein disulfide-isomerase A6